MERSLIASRLKAYRRAHRLTQAHLAAATGGEVSRARIADFEQEVGSPPTLKALRALARTMGISVRDLAGVDDDHESATGGTLILRYRLVPGQRLTPEMEAKARRIARNVLIELGVELGDEDNPRPRKKKD